MNKMIFQGSFLGFSAVL